MRIVRHTGWVGSGETEIIDTNIYFHTDIPTPNVVLQIQVLGTELFQIPFLLKAVNFISHIKVTIPKEIPVHQVLETKEFIDFLKAAKGFCDFLELERNLSGNSFL